MAFWDDIVSGGVTGLLKGVGAFAKDVRTAITGKEALTSEQQLQIVTMANALENAANTMEQRAADGQVDLNKIDAQSGSVFKGGWRPTIGWVCSFGLGYSFILKPLLPWIVSVSCIVAGKTVALPPMPSLDMKELMALTFCLLGFGGFRMYEKIKGVSSKQPKTA